VVRAHPARRALCLGLLARKGLRERRGLRESLVQSGRGVQLDLRGHLELVRWVRLVLLVLRVRHPPEVQVLPVLPGQLVRLGQLARQAMDLRGRLGRQGPRDLLGRLLLGRPVQRGLLAQVLPVRLGRPVQRGRKALQAMGQPAQQAPLEPLARKDLPELRGLQVQPV
jgi:hypothetical protein